MFKKISGTFLIRLASAIINLLIAILISRYLGAEGKGEQGILIATISFIIIFDNIVGGATVVYLTPRLKLRNLLITSYLWPVLVGMVAWGCLSMMEILPRAMILPVIIISAIASLHSVNSSILLGREEIGKSNLAPFIVPLLTIVLTFAIFEIAGNVSNSSYMLALFLAHLSAFMVSFIMIWKWVKQSEPSHINEIVKILGKMLRYGIQNQLGHVLQLLNFRLSYYFLEHFWGTAQVGVYSNGVSIIESVWMVSGSISVYQYSRIVNSDSNTYSIELTGILIRFAMLAGLLVIIPVILIPSWVYTTIFGVEFSEMNRIIILLAPGVWIFNYFHIIGHYFSGTGRYYVNALASAAGTLALIPMLLILVPQWSIYGAAIAASISYIISAMAIYLFYIKAGGKWEFFPSWQEIKEFSSKISGLINKND